MATGWPMKVTYANGDVYSASDVNDTNGTINLLQTSTLSVAGGKNRAVNGGMDWWQRGTSFAATSSFTYTADRWQSYRPGGGGTVTRQATSDTTNLPTIQYCLRFQRDAANTSTQILQIATSFETINSIPFAGQTVTMSFYARRGANYSSTSNLMQSYIITGTGTDQNIYNSYTGQSNNIQNNTLTTTWQRFTQTITVPTTSTEIALVFLNTPVGTAGANDYFEVTGVQLELGSTATTFSRAGGTIQGELAACQRYYFRSTDSNSLNFRSGINGAFAGTTTAYLNFQFPTTMRIAPTSIEYSSLYLYDYGADRAVTSLTLLANGGSNQGFCLTAGVASGGTQYRPVQLTGGASTSAYIGLSAEL